MANQPITINDVRLSYVSVFQPKPPFNNPNGDPKFSTTVLVPKTNTAAKALIDQAVAAAIEVGVAAKWGGIRPPQPAICVHDGDGPRPSDGSPFGAECRGCWVFTASSQADRPPFMVDEQMQRIIDPTRIYSGVWANVSVTFYAYSNAGKKGIGCGLNGLQRLRDGEPLGGFVTAEEAFKPIAPAAQAAPAYGAPAAPQPAAPWGAPAAPAPAYGAPAAPWGAPAAPETPAAQAVPTAPYAAPWGN